MRLRLFFFSLTLAGLTALGSAELAELPPGHNVHQVLVRQGGGTAWRGGAPTRQTLLDLQARARERKRPLLLIDLRHPDNEDDRSGKSGRLSPEAERQLASELGLRYVSISALDHDLVPTMKQGLKDGDIYVHCMYGVNRTGFAMGRYATATHCDMDREALGKRDWQQGVDFETRVQRER